MSDDLELDAPQPDGPPENGSKPRRKRAKKGPVTPPHWGAGELPDQPIPVYYGNSPEAPMHFARCALCPSAVTYQLSTTGAGIIVVERLNMDVFETLGIGANGIPICPHGHGEMRLEDENTLPVGDALAQIAGEQQALFELSKPFNFEDAWIAVADKAEEVKTIAGIYERDAATAKQSKKDLEAAESTLRAMIATLDDRRLQKARETAQRAADADSLESLSVRATAAGKVVDVASLRALTVDERAALEAEIATVQP